MNPWVVWALLAEPGDELAGLLRLSLGADKSLSALMAENPVKRILRLIDSEGYSEAARERFGKLEQTLADGVERYRARWHAEALNSAMKATRIAGASVVTPDEPAWPTGLSDLGLAMPAALWFRGDLAPIQGSVAMVGSRSASNYGAWVCAEFVGALAEKGLATVSGGAFGIDAHTHRAAISLGAPTFAVMAGGIDRLYPSAHSEWLREINVIAELPPGNRPTRWRFLQRNRLIAALSSSTVVVEAGWRSGAINTANHALGLGRPLGAVPGQITSASSGGTNKLIADGKAALIGSADQLLELAGVSTATEEQEIAGLASLDLRVLDALTSRAQHTAALAVRANATEFETAMALASLELLGRAERDSGDSWRKTR